MAAKLFASSPSCCIWLFRTAVVQVAGLFALWLVVGLAQAQVAFRAAASAGVATNAGVVTYRGSGTQAVSDGGGITPGLPTGTTQGDLLVLVVHLAGSTTDLVAPSGWTQMQQLDNSGSGVSGHAGAVFYRIAPASPAAPTVANPTANRTLNGQIMAFYGVHQTTPISARGITLSTNDATTNAAAVTGGTAGSSMVVVTSHIEEDCTSAGTPTPGTWTQAFSSANTSGETSHIAAHYRLQSASGSQAAVTLTRTGNCNNDDAFGVQFVIAPRTAALTIPVPSGTTLNDVMIATVAVRPSGASIGTPSGWTLVRNTPQTNDVTMNLATFRKVATASEPGSYTWTFSGTSNTGAAGIISSFSGVDTTTPINVEGGNTTGSAYTHTANQITTTVTNTMLVSSHSFTTASTWTAPSGMTEAADVASETAPAATGLSLEMNYVTQATAGATGNKTATAASGGSTDAGYGAAHLLALKPAGNTMTIATPGAAAEGNSTTSLDFTVSLSGTATATTTATYTLSNGTATGGSSCTSGVDFINTGGTVTINTGSATGTIAVTICGDTLYEADETFSVTLSSPVNAYLGSPSSATGTLTNDDSQPTISVGAASVTEGNGGTTTLTIPVTLSNASYQAVSASYATSNGTATGGASCSGSTDYVTISGTVSIAAGSTSGSISITVCGDTTSEADETLGVTLSSPVNGTLGTSTATGTIANDDAALNCYTDTFTGSDGSAPSTDWKTSSSSGSFGQPKIIGNRLRLTDATNNVATAAHLQKMFPGAGNKVIVEFDNFAYGGNGADGIAFTMSDAAVTASAGAYGGSLGYAQRTGVSGFAGGWLGIGLDEFGNFANPTEGRSGGTGFTVDAITVRGSGSGTTGYDFHATSGTLSPGIDAAAGGTVTHVGAGTPSTSATGNVTPTLPAHAANDILLCAASSDDNNAHSVGTSGWAQVYQEARSNNVPRASLWWKRAASAAETSPTITHAGATIVANCSAFRGVDTTTAFDVTYAAAHTAATTTTSANITSGSLTTATNGAMILFIGYIDNDRCADSYAVSTAGGLTWSQSFCSDYNGPGSGDDVFVALHYASKSTAGAVGPIIFSHTGGTTNNRGTLVTLRPSAATVSGYRYRITVDHTDGIHAYTTVERDTTATGGSYSTVIAQYDAKAQSGQAAVPTNWMLSYTGSTGGSTNIHEIDNLSICTVQTILPLGPDHYVISHSEAGITCEAEPVTFTAHAAAHTRTDAGGKTLSISTSSTSGAWVAAADTCTQTCYNTSGTSATCAGTFTATTGNNGQASYAFATGESGVRLCLRHNATGNVNINVTDGTATESTGTASAEASPGADPILAFSNTGFRFYADGSVDTLGNLTAGLRSDVTDATWQPTPQTIVIRALKSGETTPAKCVSLLGSTAKTVQFAYQCTDPAACHASSGGLEINGTAVTGSAAVPTPASNVSVTFDGSGSGTINLKYWDVGSIKLYAAASIADAVTGGTAGIVTGSSNAFLVKPYGFTVMACSGSAPCTAANSSATDGTGSSIAKAGDPFNATVRAVAYGGTVITPSFGLGTGNGTETVLLSHTLVAPGGSSNSGSLGGTTSALRSSFTDGVASVTNLTWNEVGVMTLTAANSTFQTVAAAATGTSGNIGRFTPHHFGVTGTVVTRSDVQTSEGQALPFTYMGEPMRLWLNVTAFSKGESMTLNYKGNFAKLDATMLGSSNLVAWTCTVGSQCMGLSATSGGNLTSRLAIDTTSTNSAAPTNMTVCGGATSGWATGASCFALYVVFNRGTTPDGPYSALKFGAKPLDADGITLPPRDDSSALPPPTDTTHCVNLDATTGNESALCDPGSTENNLRRKLFETQQRFGRLRLVPGQGSTRVDFYQQAEMQYWSGSNWLTNAADSLTPLTSDNFALDLSPTGIASVVGVGNINQGFGYVQVRPNGTVGTAIVCMDLATAANGCGGATTAADFPYLLGNWTGAGYDRDPSASILFGAPNSRSRSNWGYLYRRENF